MTKYILVVTATDSAAEADRIADALVRKRLAASAQRIGPIRSVFWWRGLVQTVECVFRSKVTTHFGAKLPLISEQSYHLFRSESFHFLCRCRNGW